VPTPLDAAAMHAAAQHLVGTHDFESFQSAGSERESTVRTVFAAEVDACPSNRTPQSSSLPAPGASPGFPPPSHAWRNPNPIAGVEESVALIAIEVEGDGFLYNMVRSIAGTLIEVGRGKRKPSWVADVLAARDRTQAGQTAPAHGLMLLWVAY
jgi:tRNA pseudouridine38-40 synthase